LPKTFENIEGAPVNSYKLLAYEQRYQIYFMLKMGFSQTDITEEIGVP